MRDTSSEDAGPGDRSAEIAAVQEGRIVNWDAYEALLDDILYSKVWLLPPVESYTESLSVGVRMPHA